jgi:cell fate regulator YaaT (PSP1 superfamily)
MAKIIGVRFKPAGKIYDFDPGAFVPARGAGVIVETEQGLAYGTIATEARMVDEPPSERPYKKVYRLATAKDVAQVEQNAADERRANAFCRRCVK